MDAYDPVCPAYLQGPTVKPEARLAAGMVKDLYVPPPDSFAHAQANGLGKGLFSGEAKSKGRRWEHTAIAKFLLIRGKDPVDKTVSPSINNFIHSLDLYEICAKTINHFNLLNEVHKLTGVHPEMKIFDQDQGLREK